MLSFLGLLSGSLVVGAVNPTGRLLLPESHCSGAGDCLDAENVSVLDDVLKAWKTEMESRCEKLQSLQCVAENVSSKAGHGNATGLVDKLNHLSDQMNLLLTKTATRQVSGRL